MSRQFNNTTSLDGLVQKFEEEIGATYGDVSGSTERLKQFASATRSAWSNYLRLASKGSGKWQYDDSNHTEYPIIYFNIVSGQQDYTFTTDEQNNLILDIAKVAVLQSSTATEYQEIAPVDPQTESEASLIADSLVSGVPSAYDKLANGIFLTPIPNYSVTAGIKLYINREASHFEYDDTTKMPGCPGNHHEYFYLRPAMEYARLHTLANFSSLRDEVMRYEGDESRGIIGMIERDFARRTKDQKPQITLKKINYI